MKAFVTADLSPESLAELKKLLQDEVIYESWRETKNLYFDAKDLVKKIKEIGAEILICEGDNVKKAVIENVDLKIICSTRDDPNNIDIKAANAKTIPVLFTPKRNTPAVAELTVALILSLARNLHSVERILHSDKFVVDEFSDYVKYYNMFKGFELSGKTIGIIGLGSIGYSVSKMLYPFKVKFLIYDPYLIPARLQAINGESVDLNTLMANSDIITIHCPPIDETDGLVGEDELNLMKSSAYLINLARASVIDEVTLLEMLKEKKIAGAALDVFSVEPVDQDNEFLGLDNVIVTPHLGGDTYDTNHRHGMMAVEGIKAILNKQIPKYIKNPEVLLGYSPSVVEETHNTGEDIPITLERYATEIQSLINTAKILIKEKYNVGTAGNLSLRVQLPNGQDAYIVSPSTVNYDEMTIFDVVLVDDNGETIAGTRNPTSETKMHIRIYQERDDVNAIIHSHAPFSTILSIAKIPIGPIVDEVIPFIGGCEVAEYGFAGTDELAENAIRALGDNYCCFLANHGNICAGIGMGHAWTICQQVEMTSKIQYHASLLGTIYALPEDAEEQEKEIFDVIKEVNSMK